MKLIRTLIENVYEGAVKRFDALGRPGESFKNREYMQHYGFTSRPKEGAEGMALFTGNTVVMIATDDRRYRLKVEDGEVALYTDEGDFIHFKRGNALGIKTKTLEIQADESCTLTTKKLDISAEESCTLTTKALTLKAATKVTVESPEMAATGAIAAAGDIADKTGTMQQMRGTYNTHTHNESDGGTTQAPGGQM